jgi:hypothetical protein
MDRKAIIEKIKALMSKGNDSSTTEAESIAFLNKAFELLSKHNLEESDLNDETIEVNIDETAFAMTMDTSWFSMLSANIANMYFCKATHRKRNVANRKSVQNYYVFYGKEHNRLMAVNMFDYLLKTMHRLARNHSDNLKDQYEFKKGCSIRLAHLISEITEKNKHGIGDKSGLPALYNNELALVNDYLNAKIKLTNRNNVHIRANNGSFHSGMSAANTISLNNQIHGSKSSAKLIV